LWSSMSNFVSRTLSCPLLSGSSDKYSDTSTSLFLSSHSNAANPSIATPTAPAPLTSTFAPPVGDAVALAALPLPLPLPLADVPPEARPPVALDTLALMLASAAGSKLAVTPVPLLHLLKVLGAEDVKVMSAHCSMLVSGKFLQEMRQKGKKEKPEDIHYTNPHPPPHPSRPATLHSCPLSTLGMQAKGCLAGRRTRGRLARRWVLV
jgi:hypothetical protein